MRTSQLFPKAPTVPTLARRGKLRLGVLFGGKSAEHEVSLISAKGVLEHLDNEKYDITLIGIDKQGKWHLYERDSFLEHASNPKRVRLAHPNCSLISSFDGTLYPFRGDRLATPLSFDVIFPVLHGPYGEDGILQGLLQLWNLPFVGARVLGSAIGMDKDVTKRLLREANLPVVPYHVFHAHEPSPSFAMLEKEFGLPFFIKPANLGSSVGVTKVLEEASFANALSLAFAYDSKILVEKAAIGHEFQCAVLGNEHPIPSIVGEIHLTTPFYTFDAKYIAGPSYSFPANISQELSTQIQALSLQAYKTLCCDGTARIDFLYDERENLYISEMNTIPGYTPHSTFPSLWKASGIPFSELLDRLIALALERHQYTSRI